MMKTVLDTFQETGLIPVIKIDEPDKSEALGNSLKKGGIGVAEIVLRTDNALKAIEAMKRSHPDILVGAGTVLSIEQVKNAVAAGAEFIVSPGLNKNVVSYCLENNISVFPGVNTPTDIETALEIGLKTLKFFPAEASGGMEYLKAISAPYNKLSFIPTGGISENNIGEYISYPCVTACGGSWFVKSSLIQENNFSKIESLCRVAVQKAMGLKILEIGISSNCSEEALSVASMLSELLGGTTIPTVNFKTVNSKENIISLKTNSLSMAMSYFKKRGIDLEISKIKDTDSHFDLKTRIASFKIRILKNQE